MNDMKPGIKAMTVVCLLVLAPFAQWSVAAGEGYRETEQQETRRDARELVDEAITVVRQMESDLEMKQLIQRAEGIFIVPDYGKAAVGVGGQGGEGVMLEHRDGEWSNPVFYDTGSISFGVQVGASAGAIVMLLMSDKAVNSFRQENNFSLNADAGLTIVDYSAVAQASAGLGDIVIWSDTEGAFAGVAISVTDIVLDEEENNAYYGREVAVADILDGKAAVNGSDREKRAENLKEELKS